MNKHIAIAAALLLSLSALLQSARVEAVRPGNIKFEVNHNAVLDGQIRVCDAAANMPDTLDEYGVLQWNEAIGATILTADCSLTGGYRGVTVTSTDTGTGVCGYTDAPLNTIPAPACGDFPQTQERATVGQFWTPLALGYTSLQQQTIIVHELGHNLGFDHYNSSDSIMNSNVPPNYLSPYRFIEPLAIDITNYHTAYTPPAPAVSASPPAPGQVQLTWTDNSWNEETFAIYRDGTWVATAPRNTTSLLLTGQPPGQRLYKMGGTTKADCFGFGGFCAAGNEVSVTVAGSIDLVGSAYQLLNGSLTPTEEAAAQRYRITVRNDGTLATGGSYAAIKFNGLLAPDGNGICWIPSVSSGGGTNFCDTVAVTTDFAGGPITVTADSNGNLVAETNETNNVWSSGATLAVVPLAPSPSAVQVVPPYAVYQYPNSSSIETGYSIKVEWKSTCSGSTGWSSTSPGRSRTESQVAGQGSNIQVVWGFPTGKCYRLRVRVNGQFSNAAWITGPTWLCC